MLQKLDNMNTDDLWLAVSMLNPEMKDFFIFGILLEQELCFCSRESDYQTMMRSVFELANKNNSVTGSPHVENTFKTTAFGKESNFEEEFIFSIKTPNCDKLVCYLVDNLFTTITFYLTRDSMSAANTGWSIRVVSCHFLKSHYALRKTSASSAGSGGHFSAVNRWTTADCSYLGSDIIANTTYWGPLSQTAHLMTSSPL